MTMFVAYLENTEDTHSKCYYVGIWMEGSFWRVGVAWGPIDGTLSEKTYSGPKYGGMFNDGRHAMNYARKVADGKVKGGYDVLFRYEDVAVQRDVWPEYVSSGRTTTEQARRKDQAPTWFKTACKLGVTIDAKPAATSSPVGLAAMKVAVEQKTKGRIGAKRTKPVKQTTEAVTAGEQENDDEPQPPFKIRKRAL